jgi:curved DNA-binding protein CbpA
VTEGPWAPPRLIAWLRSIGPKVDLLGPWELLEITPVDDLEAVREAYHRIAATRHPDLFRGKLGEVESEQLMRLFARVTGAYALLKDSDERRKHGAKPRRNTPAPGVPVVTAPAAAAATPSGGVRKIAPRAMSHLRRAEAMLRIGDPASAVLHLRMAVAADPLARELRQLLAETESKLKKG